MCTSVGDSVMALAGVVGTVRGDRADVHVSGDLAKKLGQHGRIANVATGDLYGSDLQRLFIHADVDLAPKAAFRATMLAGMPLPLALGLDAGAVDQQVQRSRRATVGNADGQGLLAPAQRAEIWHRPVEADQAQKALDEAGRLTKRHAEQHFHRKAGLDRGVAILRLPAAPAGRRRHPRHVRIEPDRQGAALLEGFIVGRPVLGLVVRRDRSAHADQLPHWIHEMNPIVLCATKPFSAVN